MAVRGDDPGPAATGLLSVAQAAQLAGVSHHIISSWITRGLLPAMRMVGRCHIHPDDLATVQARVHAGAVVPAWRDDPRHAGTRLRALREAGFSQLQLDFASGLTHETISRLKAGRKSPYAGTVVRLAQALRVEPERFVGHDRNRAIEQH